MSADVFLSEYWQKKPLLIKQALADFNNPISPEELAGLACEASVESRIILEKDGQLPWELRKGPFQESDFSQLPKTHWTLLVQDVEKHLPELSWLTDLFHFIPDWRLDDLMISFASDQGSVGPHLDAYDVFLLQAYGKRHWKINADASRPMEKLSQTELAILKTFEAEQEWIVEPGDLLYLPPGVAHYGIAEGDCMTYSIGFRAPSHINMVEHYADDILESIDTHAIYQDPQLSLQAMPHELTQQSIEHLKKTLDHYLNNRPELIHHWAGTLLSLGKEGFQANSPDDALTKDKFIEHWEKTGIVYKNTALKFLFIHTDTDLKFYIDGEQLLYPEEFYPYAEWISSSLQIPWEEYHSNPDSEALSTLFYDFYRRGFYYF